MIFCLDPFLIGFFDFCDYDDGWRVASIEKRIEAAESVNWPDSINSW